MNPFLIVDDEASACRALGATLAIQGLGRADFAHSAADARKAVKAARYEIVFLDINMPDPQGEALLREFLELRPDLAVVMVTGLDQAEVAVRCLRAGARDYLTKPCSPTRVAEAVERARLPHQPMIEADAPLPTVDDVTDSVIRAALERTDGNLTQAAQLIGMSRSGLAKRMAKRRGLLDPPADGD